MRPKSDALAAVTPDFSFDDMRVFNSIPEHHHGIVAFRGHVVVYDTEILFKEDLIDGALYVLERQSPVGGGSWKTWLQHEGDNLAQGGSPLALIETRREVFKAVYDHPAYPGRWIRRLASGFTDGPYEEHLTYRGMIGKVVGVYLPGPSLTTGRHQQT